ncbi:MAG: DUF4352 domain-containing protein [Anaerolineae bacterium]|nr:DUF4352 domain-containing protein [Anaerolineae bacterium]MDW8068796.1 DUF4352 domain-containing protein [Anaerolineae bacterium]
MDEPFVPPVSPSSPAQEPEASMAPSSRPPVFRVPPPVFWLGGVGVALLIITLIALLALRPVLFPRRPAGIPLAVTKIIPGISPLPVPAPPVVEIGNMEVSLPIPTSLEVGGRTFPVQAATVEGAAWNAPASDPESALWAYGTVIHYVLGLAPTEENHALVNGLMEGDTIVLHLSSGARLTFQIIQRKTVAPDDPSLLAQTRPGFTLVVLEEGERPAVVADFRELVEPTPPTGGLAAGPGQPVQVGAARVTVAETNTERGLSDLPVGTVAYFVEVRVENGGTVPLRPRDFVAELLDADGNRYLPSPSLAGQGKYGPLLEEIPAGGQAEGTFAYVIPEAIAGPMLTWVFGPQSASELRARFSLPYTPPPPATAEAEVEVTQAFLGEGGEILHVLARLRNRGAAMLKVTAQDISLSSRAGPTELQIAAPPLPWEIEAGQEQEVELQFARPRSTTCVVTILGYTFEISGLPE